MAGSFKEDQNKDQNKEQNAEVLYQKMGDRWYAFSVVNDEMFVGSMTQTEMDALEIPKETQFVSIRL